MKRAWRAFIETLPFPLEFLHRDELEQRYSISEAHLPAIYRRQADQLVPFLTREHLDRAGSVAELINVVKKQLELTPIPS